MLGTSTTFGKERSSEAAQILNLPFCERKGNSMRRKRRRRTQETRKENKKKYLFLYSYVLLIIP
jgi:hypothetical protein